MEGNASFQNISETELNVLRSFIQLFKGSESNKSEFNSGVTFVDTKNIASSLNLTVPSNNGKDCTKKLIHKNRKERSDMSLHTIKSSQSDNSE